MKATPGNLNVISTTNYNISVLGFLDEDMTDHFGVYLLTVVLVLVASEIGHLDTTPGSIFRKDPFDWYGRQTLGQLWL